MWQLEEGLKFVRELQSVVKAVNYHVAIGGGVVNNGHSDKDLDLYFLPMDNGIVSVPARLANMLRVLWGDSTSLSETYDDKNSAYKDKLKFIVNGKRIDAFIC